MRNGPVLILAALCIVLAGGIMAVMLQLGPLRHRVLALEEEKSKLETQMNVLRNQFPDAELARLRDEVDALTKKLAAADEKLATKQAAAATQSVGPLSTTLPGTTAVSEDAAVEGEEEKSSFQKMMQSMGSEEMIDSTATMQASMMYSALYGELNLPADVQDQVNDILTEALREQARATFKAMEDGNMEDLKELNSPEATKNALREKLSQVLNKEEMAVWEEYEDHKSQRVLEQSYEMQLGLMAPSLSQEARNETKLVLAEEMAGAMAMNDPETVISGQTEAMNRALERLAESLSPEDYAQVERFVQQQNSMLEASRQMMEGMMDDSSSKPKVPSNEPPARNETIAIPVLTFPLD